MFHSVTNRGRHPYKPIANIDLFQKRKTIGITERFFCTFTMVFIGILHLTVSGFMWLGLLTSSCFWQFHSYYPSDPEVQKGSTVQPAVFVITQSPPTGPGASSTGMEQATKINSQVNLADFWPNNATFFYTKIS